MSLFGNVNVSVIGNRDILKCMFTLEVLPEKGLIILLFYCILLFAFHPQKLGKVAPINFDMIFFYIKYGNARF